jgi:hypothetical protein
MESGSWTDHGSVGVASSSSKSYNAIDPNLIDVDGTYYMNFGSFWNDIYQVPMNSAATKTSGSSYNMAYTSSGTHAEEGAYMYKYGSYYYLFYSAGICCGYDTSMPASGAEYKIKVCRSTSPTSGFVSSLVFAVYGSVANCLIRLTSLVRLVLAVVVLSCWRATVLLTDLVDSELFPQRTFASSTNIE